MYLLLVSLLKVSRNEPSTQALVSTAIFSRHATLYTISTRTMYTGHSFVSPLIKNSSYYNRAGRRKAGIEKNSGVHNSSSILLNNNSTFKGTLKKKQ